MKKNIHIVPHNGKWGARKEGNTRISNIYETKQLAIDTETIEAKKNHVEILIHNLDGKISQRNSYGNDPCPPKDKD